ncbi:uncharacterized protein JN550_004680 [Neoarthrinium moseri]|uniref:uncharacterized protein n=1 Tax=Neoarthrinium moseri TaxID=1658444 RepID=UPI001FDD7FCD|nr:uncharacterized protein JN550_004680 [Neoarthrinium moseri]KAI1871235.1 hypothetical protein JN550_004680 [Neoarthrinium moseri]
MERSTGGCWTCKIRHRKCDETRPNCRECGDRQISCHGYGSRPEWLDDGPRLQAELARIKRSVRFNVSRKRHARGTASASPPDTVAHDHTPAHRSRVDGEQEQVELPSLPHTGFTLRESQLLIHYLDYIFPKQFPYYQDQPELGGRGWLLWLAMRNGPMYQSILSLAALHQFMLLGSDKQNAELQLIEYHTGALRALREFLGNYASDGHDSKEQLAEFIGSGLFLISFEVFRGGIDNWQSHLTAISAVATKTAQVSLAAASSSDDDGLMHVFKFQFANLLWFDILGSSSRGTSPIIPYNDWTSNLGVQTSTIMGCHSWIMNTIGDLACLGSRQDTQVLDDAIELEKKLETILAGLVEDEEDRTQPVTPMITAVSRVFASAALVELHVICPSLHTATSRTSLREKIAQVIEAIRSVPEPVSSRGFPWSLCVAGAPAEEDQQPFFEDMLTSASNGALPGFTNCDTALRILKECWRLRKTFPEERWTWRAAMKSLEICALLV